MNQVTQMCVSLMYMSEEGGGSVLCMCVCVFPLFDINEE